MYYNKWTIYENEMMYFDNKKTPEENYSIELMNKKWMKEYL